MGVDGKVITEIFVPKGTVVISANAAVNRSRSIWGADAREWKPERWLGPLPQTVLDSRIPGVYSNTLTFSGGSRACMCVYSVLAPVKISADKLAQWLQVLSLGDE